VPGEQRARDPCSLLDLLCVPGRHGYLIEHGSGDVTVYEPPGPPIVSMARLRSPVVAS
jgi:hypothetical protein